MYRLRMHLQISFRMKEKLSLCLMKVIIDVVIYLFAHVRTLDDSLASKATAEPTAIIPSALTIEL